MINKLAILAQAYPALRASLIKLAAEYTDHHKKLIDSDRWDISEPEFSDTRTYYKYKPSGISGWLSAVRILRDPTTGKQFNGREVFWDPEIGDMSKTEDEWGTQIIVTPKPGWIEDIPAKSSLIYRGMSSEEMDYIKSTGQIKSVGDYNLGDDQIGLTYFSTDPAQAKSYAHGFAPVHKMATPNKPAYIIAIPKREGKYVKGTGESEVGIEGSVGANEIVGIWIGEAFCMVSAGSFDTVKEWGGKESEGSRSAPSISVAWRQIK
jgi:hypothetical protein